MYEKELRIAYRASSKGPGLWNRMVNGEGEGGHEDGGVARSKSHKPPGSSSSSETKSAGHCAASSSPSRSSRTAGLGHQALIFEVRLQSLKLTGTRQCGRLCGVRVNDSVQSKPEHCPRPKLLNIAIKILPMLV